MISRNRDPIEVLVKVLAASICGTDLHIYKWDRWAAARLKPPVVIGHEMAGYIVRLGREVRGRHEGDYVSLNAIKHAAGAISAEQARLIFVRITLYWGLILTVVLLNMSVFRKQTSGKMQTIFRRRLPVCRILSAMPSWL